MKKSKKIGSIKGELIKKSREAALAAVQIFNNPNIGFKAEAFVVLMIIAWTYMLHAYFKSKNIDYRYFKKRVSVESLIKPSVVHISTGSLRGA